VYAYAIDKSWVQVDALVDLQLGLSCLCASHYCLVSSVWRVVALAEMLVTFLSHLGIQYFGINLHCYHIIDLDYIEDCYSLFIVGLIRSTLYMNIFPLFVLDVVILGHLVYGRCVLHQLKPNRLCSNQPSIYRSTVTNHPSPNTLPPSSTPPQATKLAPSTSLPLSTAKPPLGPSPRFGCPGTSFSTPVSSTCA
jgi:hypothetical protein